MKRWAFQFILYSFYSLQAIAQNLSDPYEKARNLYNDGKYSDAIKIAEKALAQVGQTNSGESYQTVKMLDFMGLCYDQLNNITEAIPIYKKVVAIARTVE